MTSSNDKGFWALKTGAVVERYQIEKVLGHGGFGITYLVTHTELGKQFALKEHFPRMFSYRDTSTTNIRASDEASFNWTLDHFIAEGRSLAKCHHPNVTMVADVFRANGTAYLVLGFENGNSLKNWLADLRRPPTQDEMDRLVFPLLDALKSVHAQGLLHRDIAADNIIIRADGSPCLIDFGAARQAVAERSMMMTAIIKSGYSPPEQYSRAGKGQGPWSDLYALGATLYFAVSGKMPAESTDRQMGEDLAPVETVVADPRAYRPSFLQAINTCLNLKLADRFQSVEAMLAVMNNQPSSNDADTMLAAVVQQETIPLEQDLPAAVEKDKSAKNISYTELPSRSAAAEPIKTSRASMSMMLMVVLGLLVLGGGGWWLLRGSAGGRSDQKGAAVESQRKKEIEPDLKNELAYVNRGNSWDSRGDYDRAITDFNRAVDRDPKFAIAYYNRGMSRNNKGEYDKAIADYNNVIELSPTFANAYFNRGNSWEKKGNLRNALADFLKFTELAPSDPDGPAAVARTRENLKSK